MGIWIGDVKEALQEIKRKLEERGMQLKLKARVVLYRSVGSR